MSGGSFGSEYASFYDALYSDKNYEAECDLIEGLFHRHAQETIRSILDLGCGTGSHSVPLAARGYEVTGVDLSEPMLEQARQKIAGRENLRFVRADVRTVDLERPFDAVLMMFAVLGYQTSDEDLRDALNAVAKHLSLGGLFLGDVWYGPAVVEIQPSDREKVVQASDGELTRLASPNLDAASNLCAVHYRLIRKDGDREVQVGEENHTMRYFFPDDLRHSLEQTGLELLDLGPFPCFDGELSGSTWNAMFVARRV